MEAPRYIQRVANVKTLVDTLPEIRSESSARYLARNFSYVTEDEGIQAGGAVL